jgi:hypothetical protein
MAVQARGVLNDARNFRTGHPGCSAGGVYFSFRPVIDRRMQRNHRQGSGRERAIALTIPAVPNIATGFKTGFLRPPIFERDRYRPIPDRYRSN